MTINKPSPPLNLIIPTEDFWSRQANRQTEVFELAPFGIPTKITANHPHVLQAAHLSAARFSQAEIVSKTRPLLIQIVVKSSSPAAPLPSDLPQQLTYTGLDHWITLSAGPWGHAFANLNTQETLIVLSAALAAETRLISRYFIDHYLLNFMLTNWAMLHASCVLTPDNKQLLVMIAPHNTGKSTTALLMLRAGYTFLADGMLLFRQQDNGFEVGGYPIGEVKLRDDVLFMFSASSGPTVQVREHHKTVLNLRSVHSAGLAENIIRPEVIKLCFVKRAAKSQTQVIDMTFEAALGQLNANTIFWAEADKLRSNSQLLINLLRVANCYCLILGTNTNNIIATIDKLTYN